VLTDREYQALRALNRDYSEAFMALPAYMRDAYYAFQAALNGAK
jgi:hypothetical protein